MTSEGQGAQSLGLKGKGDSRASTEGRWPWTRLLGPRLFATTSFPPARSARDAGPRPRASARGPGCPSHLERLVSLSPSSWTDREASEKRPEENHFGSPQCVHAAPRNRVCCQTGAFDILERPMLTHVSLPEDGRVDHRLT